MKCEGYKLDLADNVEESGIASRKVRCRGWGSRAWLISDLSK